MGDWNEGWRLKQRKRTEMGDRNMDRGWSWRDQD